MAPPVIRPDNVLKRAEELINVGTQDSALQVLHEFLTSKKTRSVAPSALEPIAILFVQLCVDLRKGHTLKDGLHQFKRNVQVSESGLPFVESVTRKLIELAEKKLQDVYQQANKTPLDSFDDDLEIADSPESILLAAVSDDQSQERADRDSIAPSIRFLWESYRLGLDLLKHNSRLEVTYGTIVQQAFKFCVSYNRTHEFKKLTDNLRVQFPTALAKGQVRPPHAVDLQDPETLQRFLDLRFIQLNSAVKLELWQEAFKAVEDTHSLLAASKRPPKPTMMVSYYENLAKIFLVGENNLFHAAAWQRFFNLYSQSPNVTDEELARYSSLFLLSTLSIVPETADNEFERRRANATLANLLNLSKVPTRDSLLQFGLQKNVYDHVDPSIKQLYNLLEGDFHPLQTREQLNSIIEAIEANTYFFPYIKSLREVILSRLFEQVSQVYETVKLDFLIQLATFKGAFELSPLEIEGFLLNAGASGRLSFYIDHDAEVVTFVNDPFGEIHETGSQSSVEELVRSQLSNLAKTLYASVQYIDPTYAQKQQLLRERLIAETTQALIKEREEHEEAERLLQERKLQAEIERKEKEAEATRIRLEKMEADRIAEIARVEEEARRRAEEKIQREKDALLAKEKRRLVDEVNAKGIIKVDVNNLEDITEEKLRIMQLEQLAKDKLDMDTRIAAVFKKTDHVERLLRKFELPLLAKDAESQKDRDLTAYNEFKAKAIAKAKDQHEKDVTLRDRLARVAPGFKSFRESKGSDIAAKREAQIAEAAAKLEAAKQARIEEVRQQRYEEQMAAYEAQVKRAQEEAKQQERAAAIEAQRAAVVNAPNAKIDESKLTFAEKMKLRKARAEAAAASNPPPAHSQSQAAPAQRSGYVPPSRRSEAPAPTPAPAAANAAPIDTSKLSFAEKMRLRREGKLP
ncbi:hypothetical protein WICPIJ_003571 [Wickerhamomyces pijperi]|uniref:Eukaryotic translation initiation factor 3 subunit A n=1 Tax=Wickerhamomyces pijperi TaxID=599730 RepID=A0A9P8TNK5_WICPI|nr:hypothetical protein WICPIJ_003571 [Wickerhamomyces pijperi]